MARTISTIVGGTLRLGATDNPLTIASTGGVTATSGDGVSAKSSVAWQILNDGVISATASSSAGMYFAGSGWNLENAGKIQGQSSGVYTSGGGTVTNDVGGLISGVANYGVFISGGPGTVYNAGTISSGWLAVDFAFNSAANRLVIAPGAVFNGLVRGGAGTLELAAPATGGPSAGSIGGINTTASGAFQNFQTIAVDAGANWTLTGANTITNIVDNGNLVVTGALPVANIQLGVGGSLEVASAPASSSPINFLGSGQLKIDNASMFGANVGSASYSGPLLENFGSSDKIDILNFSATGASLSYNSATGLLQIQNGASVVSLDFQNSTLTGAFTLASDGGTGVYLTTSSTPPVTEALVLDTGFSSTDGITSDPALTGTAAANATINLTEGGAVIATVTASAAGVWTYAPTSLAQGAHTIVASDGNTSATLSFTFDSVAPSVTESLGSGALTGTGDPNAVVTLTEGSSVIGVTTANSTGVWSYTPTSLTAGQHTIVASETDAAGNIGSSAPLTFTYTPPAVTAALVSDTGASSTDGITNNAALAGSAAPNTIVTLQEGSVTLGTAAVSASGAWSFTPTGLSQGVQTIVATDGGASASVTFNYDTTKPIPIFTATPPTSGAASTASFTFATSNTDTGVVYSYELDGATTWSMVAGSGLTLSNLANGAHTLLLEATDAAGNLSATPVSYTWSVGSGGRTISTAIAGPVVLAATDNPLTITSTGKVTSTASGADGVDGGSAAKWSITNSGAIASSLGLGVYLTSSGTSLFNYGSISGQGAVNLASGATVTNYAGGTIKAIGSSGYSAIAGVQIAGSGTVNNAGTISASSTGYGVSFDTAGTVTNSGSITGGEDGVFVYGGAGQLTNYGSITATVDDGVGFFAGGTIVNAVGASISAANAGAGVYIAAGASNIQNGGMISGKSYGIYLAAGGTVTNAGTIAGASYSIYFSANSASNKVVVDPGAVFTGAVSGGLGTLELASGVGSIGGLNTGQFTKFNALDVDAGGAWTLTGANTIASILDAGSLDIKGSLPVANIQLGVTGGSGALEVASAPGSQSQISFQGSGALEIDNASSFGSNVGSSSYAGPLLENFGSTDTIDIQSFGILNAVANYSSSTGLLQISNGVQTATLDFQNSTLGAGSFHLAADASGGLLVSRA